MYSRSLISDPWRFETRAMMYIVGLVVALVDEVEYSIIYIVYDISVTSGHCFLLRCFTSKGSPYLLVL
jgi:hypothetical protein